MAEQRRNSRSGSRLATASDNDYRPAAGVLLIAFMTTVCLAPLWFGSVTELPFALNAALIGVLVTLCCGLWLLIPGYFEADLSVVRLPAVLMLGVCLWMGVQISSDMPAEFWHPVWRRAQDIIGYGEIGAISINPPLTRSCLLWFATIVGCFLLAFLFGASGNQYMQIIQGIALCGSVLSLYGLVSWALAPDYVFWWHYPVQGGGHYVRSTFINRNHFGALAGLAALASTALLRRSYMRQQRPLGRSLAYRIEAAIQGLSGVSWVWLGATVVNLIAVAGTASRGALVATACGFGAMFAVLAMRNGSRWLAGALGAGLATGVALLMIWSGGDQLRARLDQEGLQSEGRYAVWKIATAAIGERPLTGYGAGTFSDVLPMFRNLTISKIGVWHQVHNSYLEAVLGLGWPVAVLGLLALIVLIGRCARAAVQRQRGSSATALAVGASALVALHSIVDFSLQIQSIAMIYAVLLGTGVAQSWSRNSSARVVPARTHRVATKAIPASVR